MCLQNKCFKDNDKPAHWVGHSKLRSLDIYDFFKRTQTFYENQASVTGNKEEEDNTAKDTNDETDENAETNEINGKNKEKVFTTEEEKKTLEYQETMNLDIGKN